MKFPLFGAFAILLLGTVAHSADQPQWGRAWDRNLVSAEKDLPASIDPDGGQLKWRAKLGSETHSTPVVSGGHVYIGTNNNEPRDPRHQGDRGVLMCLDEKDGRLLWQLVVPKRVEDPFFDWPKSGISSPATVEGNRVYIVSNRGEVLCLDTLGMANGNDGPFLDEAKHQTPGDQPTPIEAGPLDADILWAFDLTAGAGIWSHDAAHSSILIRGDHLYLNTGTGVDNSHVKIRAPDAPSLVVIDKLTGRYLARDDEKIGPRIFHCTWSSPSLAKVGDRELIFFAGGDGVLYAFAPLPTSPAGPEVAKLERVWKHDLDPSAPKEDVHRFSKNRTVGPVNVFGLPVVVDGSIFIAGGGDIWWGKNEAWLKRINAASGELQWTYPLNKHVMSTPAVHDGLVFIADVGRVIHCVEADTGKAVWTHETKGDFWASPYVADGKVFLGTRRGDSYVFAASREKRLLSTYDFGVPISATVMAANGTLYVATMRELFAFRGAKTAPDTSAPASPGNP